MNRITQQLRWVRRTGRVLLVTQRLCQWILAVVAVAIGASFADYLLRLPGIMRLILDGMFLACVGTWLIGRLRRAAGFRPSLIRLALRAERLYPELEGLLGSAVEFSIRGRENQPATTAMLTQSAIDQTHHHLVGISLRRMIDPTRTVRLVIAALTAMLVMVILMVSLPAGSAVAAQRWLLPLGDAQWPRRVEVESMTQGPVWPIDTALPLRAKVLRTPDPALRVWAHYRLGQTGKPSDWQRQLMNRSGAVGGPGDYELLINLPELILSVTTVQAQTATLEYYFVAGDDQTDAVALLLIARPSVRESVCQIDPPAYATGWVEPKTIRLHELTGPVVRVDALRHSRVSWTFKFNKPLPIGSLKSWLSGFDLAADRFTSLDDAKVDQTLGFTVVFTLEDTRETLLHLVDRHGLLNLSTRRYRIEVTEDRLPSVAMLKPVADESVLVTAVIAVEAAAQDDVAIESLNIELLSSVSGASLLPYTGGVVNLKMESLGVGPGDTVELTALARDVYFKGVERDIVRSTSRTLRMIDVATLVSQLRADLAAVRQQAVRLHHTQRRLMAIIDPAVAKDDQAQLSQRVTIQRSAVARVARRSERNRLEDPTFNELVNESQRLLVSAEKHSQFAAANLAQASYDMDRPEFFHKQANQHQQQTYDALQSLIALLDLGQDVLTLQLSLQSLLTQQSQLTVDTRSLMPKTLGQSLEQLSGELREQIDDLAERQAGLRQQGDQLVRDMRSASQTLLKQGANDRDRAAAEALHAAAAVAQRQGLDPTMEKSAQQLEQNRLSSSLEQQGQAQQTLQQMLRAVGSQKKHQAEILKRRLIKLSQLLERLIKHQEQQISSLDGVEDDAAEFMQRLVEPMTQLRRATLGAQDMAAASAKTREIAETIGHAVNDQGRAVAALRRGDKVDGLDGEQAALARLREALQQAQAMQKKAEADQAKEDRDKLRGAYEKLADEQEVLHKDTDRLMSLSPFDRRERAALMQQADRQVTIQVKADQLHTQVADTLIFNHLHQRIDDAADRVARQLRGASMDHSLSLDQKSIEVALRSMAKALEQDPVDEPFDRTPGTPGDTSGGGGGSSGGQEGKLIPPITELKLLRSLQQDIYDRTRTLADAGVDRQTLERLSTEQRELSSLTQRLIKQMQPPPPPPEVQTIP